MIDKFWRSYSPHYSRRSIAIGDIFPAASFLFLVRCIRRQIGLSKDDLSVDRVGKLISRTPPSAHHVSVNTIRSIWNLVQNSSEVCDVSTTSTFIIFFSPKSSRPNQIRSQQLEGQITGCGLLQNNTARPPPVPRFVNILHHGSWHPSSVLRSTNAVIIVNAIEGGGVTKRAWTAANRLSAVNWPSSSD